MKAFILALFLLLTAGCQTGWIDGNDINRVRLGMTRAEIIKMLGEPHTTEAKRGAETLWYLEDQGGYIHVPYYINIVDGKVDSYGPGKGTPQINIDNRR